MKKLRAAVIGVGYLGNFHAQKLKSLATHPEFPVDLMGVCDISADNANKVAASLQTQAFTDPRLLIGQVDLVTIATITSSHYQVAKMFLESGVHVNVEKPITIRCSQAQELIDIAKKNGVNLSVGHSERFNPAFQLIKSKVHRPIYMEAHRLAPFKAKNLDASVIHDLMIHDFDLALSFDRTHAKIVSYSGAKFLTDTIDWGHCTIEFESGFKASIGTSRFHPTMVRSIKVMDKTSQWTGNLQTGDVEHISRNHHESLTGAPLAVEVVATGKGDNLMAETLDVVQAVYQNRAPMITGQDGLRALVLAEELISLLQTERSYTA